MTVLVGRRESFNSPALATLPAQQDIHLGSTGRDLADGHGVLRAAVRCGAGPAGRASALTAANVGLAAAIVLLTVHGWPTGRAAQLRGWQLFFATSIAAALGLVMVALKDFVLIHLH